ncbi:MAG: PIN domain-containing protein [archaeon]|nr:PIN domain-containing protein [archaeon]
MVDSNILFSGLLFKGKPFKVLELIRKRKLKLIIPIDQLNEIYEVFAKEVSDKTSLLDSFLLLVKPRIIMDEEYSRFIAEASELIDDRKDIPILACTLAVKPTYFITGDKDFHIEKIKEKIRVATPGDFLIEIKAS